MPQRTIILDRDGTLNVDNGYVYRIDDWQFTDRALEALKLFSAAGYALMVVTNQSGIGRGLYTRQDVERLHAHVRDVLSREGIELAGIAYCPHAADADCDCRKPRCGMARQLETQLVDTMDHSASWSIGDKLSDMEFGRALGTRTALIRSRYWSESDLVQRPNLIVDNLYDAATRITTQKP